MSTYVVVDDMIKKYVKKHGFLRPPWAFQGPHGPLNLPTNGSRALPLRRPVRFWIVTVKRLNVLRVQCGAPKR